MKANLCFKIVISTIFSILLFSQNIKSESIILDAQNPILFSEPNVTKAVKIDIRFSFPATSKGLVYGQYFGVALPLNTLSDLQFDKDSIKYTCELYDGITIITLTAEKPSSVNDGNIAFCKLTDRTNNSLKVGSKYSYKLSLNLTVKISLKFLRAFRLFTSTSANSSRIIIDQQYFVGNIGQYDDALSFNNKSIDLALSQIVTSNTANVIYPYQNFDVTLNIKSNIFVAASDYTITFKFDKNYVSAAQSISTNAISTNPLEGAVKGSLVISQFSSGDKFSINGITEDLVPGRLFQITLKSWKALDTFTNNNSALEMIVYYKNTYSIISWVSSSSNFFRISIPTMTLSVDHPNSWDYFRNGIFPMKFIFSSPIDLPNGGFVLLRQTNTQDDVNRWNFVASTCDFSENESLIDQSFGKRPQCFPLRTDFAYPSTNGSSGYAGSGIFFKLKPISGGKNYIVTVWGSADACGGNSVLTQYKSTSVQFSFQATVYKDILASSQNESRLINQTIIGQSGAAQMKNKCWNNMTVLRDYVNPETFGRAISPYADTTFKVTNNINNANACSGSNICEPAVDVLHYREFSHFILYSVTTNLATPTNFYQDMNANTTTNKEAFIYGTNAVSGQSYFAVRVYMPVEASNKIYEVIPTPIIHHTSQSNYQSLPGRLVLNLQKIWFTSGDSPSTISSPGCYFGWGSDTTLSHSKTAFVQPDSICQEKTIASPESSASLTFIGTYSKSTGCTLSEGMLDRDKSFIPEGTTNTPFSYYRIMSKWHHGSLGHSGGFNGFHFPASRSNWTTSLGNIASTSIGLFSTCYKWNTNVSIKSLYTSLDIQLNWLYATTSGNTEGNPVRAIRLIKLFPEGGVFQDISTDSGKRLAETTVRPDITQTNQRSFKYHMSLGSNNLNVGICLIEIYGQGLKDASDSSTSNLGIWIGSGVLLEVDYDDVNANYPVAPLNSSSYKIYGLQSGYVMNYKENFNVLLDAKTAYEHSSPSGNVNRSPMTMYLHNYALTPRVYSTTYGTDLYGTFSTITYDDSNSTFPLRSSYIFLMGSFLLINGITINTVTTSTNSVVDNLLIPIYCPIHDATNNTIKNYAGMPQLYITYLTMSSFSNITAITRIYSHKLGSDSLSFTVITPNIKSVADSYKTSTTTTAKALIDTANYTNYLFTLRWTTYSSIISANENNLYLYYGNTTGNTITASSEANCTGHIFLLNSNKVSLDSSVTKSSAFSGSSPAVYKGTNKFYYLGNEFHQSIMIGLGSSDFPSSISGAGTFSANTMTDESTDRFIIGIKRPSIESFFINGNFGSLFNSIGYFCNSAQKGVNEIFTNYVYHTSTKGFIIDFNPPSTSIKTFTVKIVLDKSEGPFKSDPAGNMRFDISLPAKTPGGTSLNLYSSSTTMNSNTRCGLGPATNLDIPVSECLTSSNLITCPLDRTDINYTICCYNVKIEGDSFSLSQLYISVPAQPVIGSNVRYNSSTLYTAQSQISQSPNALKFDFIQSQYTDISSANFSAKIEKIDYQQVIQESGFGKFIMTLTIPREPVRNMALAITGDFSGLYIQNSSPRCIVTFGTSLGANWQNTADFLLDSCELKSFNSSSSQIIVTLKDMVYKCSQAFTSKTLTIIIHPIIIANWNNIPFSSNTYSISMTLNSSTKDAIAATSLPASIKTNLTYLSKPVSPIQYDSLCAVSAVTPKIPGEYADYQFEIDLDLNKSFLNNSSPNEITIFFPFNHYGPTIENVLCYNNNIMLNCLFTDEGILNIRFTTNLAIGSGKKIPIIVTGIFNPTFDSDIFFPCTVNSTNFMTGIRTNLIAGSGKLANGISLPSGFVQGSLRFLNLSNTLSVSNNNPRNTSIHTFRVSFDLAISTITLPIKITNTPQLVITFPTDYKLAWYNNSRVTATIDEYISDINNIISKNKVITPTSVSQSGNRVTLTINADSYEFSTKYVYWDVNLSNLTGPLDNTSLNSYGTTGPYKILLTNSNYSSIYSIPNNLNNYSSTLATNRIDNLIESNRGAEFKFDNTKWVIDINTSGVLNSLVLKPGRFQMSTFNIKTNPTNNILPRSGTVSLNDQIFKLAASSYGITSSSYQGVPFYIGVPCTTAPGSYLLNFTLISDDITSFAQMPPVIVILDNSSKGLVTISTPAPIPEAGSTFISFSLSEPNVDVLNINFVAVETNKNDSTAIINPLTIPAAAIPAGTTYSSGDNLFNTLFSITNSNQKNVQSFKPSGGNNCYDWSLPTISINISGIQAIIPNNYNFTNSFKYFNSDSDATLKIKNAIKLIFTPPYSPIYLFCALVCNNRNFPTDDTLIAAFSKSGDSLTKYYNSMFNSKSPVDIIFDNLVRGQIYKLKCIIQSTQGNIKDRTSAKAEIEKIDTNNGTTIQIIPTNTLKTQCVQYYFTSDPGQATKIAIVNYCQKVFSSAGWSSSGCIICTDSGLTYIPPGLTLPNNLTCTTASSKNRLRFLQTTPTVTSSNNLTSNNAGMTVNPALVNQSNPITFSVCPIQYPVCPTDIAGNKLYIDYFNQLISDTKTASSFVSNLAITNVPVNNTFVVSDLNFPDISKNFNVQILAVNNNGLLQWSASYLSALRCSWQISEVSASPSSGSIIYQCSDIQWCGNNFIVGTISSYTSTMTENLKPFISGKSYALYFACTNDVPYSTNISNVYSVNFSLPNSPSNPSTPMNTNSTTNTNGTSISGNFAIFNYFILALIGLLI